METPECPIKSLSLDEAIAHADEVAGDCGTACKREHKQLADWLRELKSRRSAERGDAAKLREALKAIGGLCAGLMPTWDGAVGRIKDIAEAALSAPPRNCDVGTVKEQSQRFDSFCDAHKYVGDDGANWCSRTCPCYNDINCGVNWAQMPYEEGGAE